MVRFRSRSLYVTVVLPIVVLVLASMAGVFYAASSAMREGVRVVARQRAQYGLAYMRTSIEEIEHVMQAERGITLQAELERLSHDPDRDAVRILSPDGKVLHSSRRAEVGSMMPAHVPVLSAPLPAEQEQIAPQLTEGPGIIHAAVPVRNRRQCEPCHAGDGPILGILDVDISLSRQTAGMRTWAEMAGVATILQFTIIAVGTVIVLSLTIVRPVRRLERRMREMRLGNYAITAEIAGTTELDSLVAGFNEMVGRLRRADEVEQDAQRAKLARVEQMATMGEWAASLAHELRNPLSGVKAAIDVLAKEAREEEPKRILTHVSGELARVDGVVRQLLNFAKPKAPEKRTVELRSALDDAVTLSRPRANAREVRLDTDFPAEPVEVVTDPEMVRQVVLNLILNALQAIEGTPEPRVVVSIETRGQAAWCRVRDNGPGVPADRAAAIFRPFSTTKIRGTGLGLPTSRRVVELLGGELVLENPGEPGASFAFSLPISPGAVPA